MDTVCRRGRELRAWAVLLVAGPLCFITTAAVPAQEVKGRNDGLYITVSTALTKGNVDQIEQRIKDAQKKEHRTLNIIIFDFNPGGQPNSNSDDGACNSLRKLIQKLRKGGEFGDPIKTVAFVSNEVSRHSVLPVLACSELVMADDPEKKRVGSIGNVLRGRGALDEGERQFYDDVAANPGLPVLSGSKALVYKMIPDPNLVIHRVKYNGATRYWEKKEIEQKKAKGEDFVDEGPAVELNTGQPTYDASLARALTLCAAIRNDPAEVVHKYHLPRGILTEVWLGDRPMSVGLIEVHGQLDKGKLQALGRRIERASARNVNFLILYLDCPGGDNTDAAHDLGQVIAKLKNDTGEHPVRTVAYVPSGVALGAGTYLALGCNEIIMGKDAVLGDFSYFTDTDDDHAGRRRQLLDLAKQQGYPPAVFEAMLDRRITLVRVQSDANDYQIVTKKEFLADKNSGAPKWREAGEVHPEGEFFKLTADKAREFEIARPEKVEAIDQSGQLDEVYKICKVLPDRVIQFREDWLEALAEFFRRPLVKLALIMIGILGMILELKMPGTTLPGIVAAICFVFFFWAHSSIAGDYTILAVLLFVLGLVLIGLEVFVFPGFGVPGIAGILLVVGSLVLVTLEKMPSTTREWGDVGWTLVKFGGALTAAIAGAFMVAYYLPHIPYANRLVLAPPPHDAEGEGRAADNPLAGLLGAIGVAETSLRPAGKARFGEDFYDVIAEGDFLNPGSRVQVIEIEGQRIVVKEV